MTALLESLRDELVVFIRIGLFVLSGYLGSQGWLPEEAKLLLVSPEAVEAATGILLGAVTLIWYIYSKARKALRSAAPAA